jgi:hypothetical protein
MDKMFLMRRIGHAAQLTAYWAQSEAEGKSLIELDKR